MKKIVCALLCVLMAFSLISCDMIPNIQTFDIGSSNAISYEAQTDAEETVNNDKTANDNEDTEYKEEEKEAEQKDDADNGKQERPTSIGNVNNGVLEKSSRESMKVPKNMMALESGDATEENNSKKVTASVVKYTLDGRVINWITEDDFIYVITEGNNRLIIIDSLSMSPICNTPLPGIPAEINIIDDMLYISFPDLYKIVIYSKSNGEKLSSLYFDHEISSFCIDGDYIYYSEHDQHCEVYRKNFATQELTRIGGNDKYMTFYFPKLYLNKEDGILYIGESGGSGCALYYYDAYTLKQTGVFEKDNYGISNNTREIFHIGDEIFWGNYRLSDTNAKEIIGKYGAVSYGSVEFASEEIVSTHEGLFLTDTYECIINYFDEDFDYPHILVTESYNLFFREDYYFSKEIIGINFNFQ